MALVVSSSSRRIAFLRASVAASLFLACAQASAQSGAGGAATPVFEGRVIAMPADNLLVTDIEVGRLRAAQIIEGEVVDVEVGTSPMRGRFVSRDELERLLVDPAAWATADVDVLCYETGDRTLAITAPSAPLADLVPTQASRHVVVTKP